jgi:guanylate kinase
MTSSLFQKRQGILFVLSAPSGGGKSTLLKLLKPFADHQYSVSCTTRAPRPGEIDGTDYHFLTRAQFEQEIAHDNLLEWAEVHGNFYGTKKSAVLEHLDAGRDVILDIDIQGAESIRASNDPRITSALVDVFLTPASIEVVEHRLRKRATETEQQLSIRITNAINEMAQWNRYAFRIISTSPEADLEQFRAIMQSERNRCSRFIA